MISCSNRAVARICTNVRPCLGGLMGPKVSAVKYLCVIKHHNDGGHHGHGSPHRDAGYGCMHARLVLVCVDACDVSHIMHTGEQYSTSPSMQRVSTLMSKQNRTEHNFLPHCSSHHRETAGPVLNPHRRSHKIISPSNWEQRLRASPLMSKKELT